MGNVFPTPEQEAQRAANELYEIKLQIRELLNKLNLIEKRLKVVAPTIESKKTLKAKSTIKRSFSEEILKNSYEELLSEFNVSAATIQDRLYSKNKDELEALAIFLGLSVAKKPSQKSLVDMILGRLKESRLLRSGIN